MANLRFVGRVAIVTGAGGGLGRTYALDLAKRGAKVVVNDLGGDRHGTSSSTSMADKVVGEIRSAGGTAVANYDSVEFGDKIVKTAIDNFGRIDIVINNAGILRDVAFVNMKDIDWDLIMKVHLTGAYSVTKAAWPYMRQQKYGRVIFTSSNSGVYGSFGQANYAAAKMGLVGLSNSLALEGAKYNILCNSLVPTAGSRLTQTVMPEEMVNALKPDYVTPLAVYLSHEDCKETGKVFEAGAGWYGTLQYYRSSGKVIPNATAEDVRDHWTEIIDMKNAQHFESSKDVSAELMSTLSEAAQDKENTAPSTQGSKLKSAVVFEEINNGLKQKASSVGNVNAIILYILTENGQEVARYTIDLKNKPFTAYRGDVKNDEKPTTTVTVPDDVFADIALGKLNPQQAFMKGKLRVKGNLMLLQKLQKILEQQAKI